MIKYLIMDVDGSLTDGKIYMGSNGEIMKAFSIKDGYVFNYILRPNDIVPIILTARKSAIVQKRCEELGIKEVHQGKLNKLNSLKEIVGKENLCYCSYFGDDLIDLQCMKPIQDAGGIVGCPADAVQEIKAVADYICLAKAGDGALREFAEWLVKPQIDAGEILDAKPNYLFFEVEDKRERLSPKEKEMIRIYRSLDVGRKECIIDTLKYFAENCNENE